MNNQEHEYIDPSNLDGGKTPVATPSEPPPLSQLRAFTKKYEEFIKLSAKVITTLSFLLLLTKISGMKDITNAWLCVLLIGLMMAYGANEWVNEKSSQSAIVALIICFSLAIIINVVYPGWNVKTALDSLSVSKEINLQRGVKNEEVDIPNNTNVNFKSNKRFAILERRGTNPDGTYLLFQVEMPPGNSKRYFVWGGNIILFGLYDGTELKVSY